MTYQIQRLINRVKMSEAKAERNIMLSTADAKEIVSEITLLLLQMESLRNNQESNKQESDIQNISMSGGSFKDV